MTSGIFLHFQDNSRLGHYIFLQNKWVTDAVYKILDDEIIETEQKGQFNKNDLPRIWFESTYARRRNELLELMLQFELCSRSRY
jgi:hypothetical protein